MANASGMKMQTDFPVAAQSIGPGQRIGLLGGSFDPAHTGHVHISLEAIKRFDLDWVWWLVSPGNPLKDNGPVAMDRRLKRARSLVHHPRIIVTDLETHLNTRYTARTLAALTACYPRQRFVWLMGSDNLVQFHLWQDWRAVMEMMPVGVISRPGTRMAARRSPAARSYARDRLRVMESHLLGRMEAPCWCLAEIPLDPSSSSAIRARGGWS